MIFWILVVLKLDPKVLLGSGAVFVEVEEL